MKNLKNLREKQKGITLIALVITIIVMLILVAVTISMAINGGLFDYVGKATGETKNAIANEQELANLESDLTVDQLIDKYTNSQEETTMIDFNIGGDAFQAYEGESWISWYERSKDLALYYDVVNMLRMCYFGDPLGMIYYSIIGGGLINSNGVQQYWSDEILSEDYDFGKADKN